MSCGAQTYRLDPCPPCPPYWYGQATYTARCPSGQNGDAVTVRKDYRSPYSLAHARKMALAAAKAEADALLVCTWSYTACLPTEEGQVCFTATSSVSFVDAQQKALVGAIAAAA